MCKKQSKTFRFQHDFVKPVVKNGKIASEKLTCTVEALATKKEFSFDPQEPLYDADIVTIEWHCKDITAIIYHFDLQEPVETAALSLAKDQFQPSPSEVAETEKKFHYVMDVVHTVKGSSILSFYEPVTVRLSDWQVLEVHGIQVGGGKLFLYDYEGMSTNNGEELLPSQLNADKVIAKLEERLLKTFGRMERKIA